LNFRPYFYTPHNRPRCVLCPRHRGSRLQRLRTSDKISSRARVAGRDANGMPCWRKQLVGNEQRRAERPCAHARLSHARAAVAVAEPRQTAPTSADGGSCAAAFSTGRRSTEIKTTWNCSAPPFFFSVPRGVSQSSESATAGSVGVGPLYSDRVVGWPLVEAGWGIGDLVAKVVSWAARRIC
jgi:hypothetical protein